MANTSSEKCLRAGEAGEAEEKGVELKGSFIVKEREREGRRTHIHPIYIPCCLDILPLDSRMSIPAPCSTSSRQDRYHHPYLFLYYQADHLFGQRTSSANSEKTIPLLIPFFLQTTCPHLPPPSASAPPSSRAHPATLFQRTAIIARSSCSRPSFSA